MCGTVIVTGLPDLICLMKSGMTDPREHMTVPYRTRLTMVDASGSMNV